MIEYQENDVTTIARDGYRQAMIVLVISTLSATEFIHFQCPGGRSAIIDRRVCCAVWHISCFSRDCKPATSTLGCALKQSPECTWEGDESGSNFAGATCNVFSEQNNYYFCVNHKILGNGDIHSNN